MEDERFWRILVPVDGSDASLMAQETAAMVAKKTGKEVTVLHVIREVEKYYHLLYAAEGLEHELPYNLIKELLDQTEKEAKRIVNDARSFFKEEGITIYVKTLRGNDPADTILEFSKRNYDLIVMGARGKNEKNPHALGSVAKKVVRHTTCPTLLAKKDCYLSNLLVCIDGSEHSIKALSYALELAEKIGSKITLLNVQERRLYSLSPYAHIVSERLGKAILAKALGAIGKKGLRVGRRVEFGVTSDRIVEVAERKNQDLIVLGSRGLGTVKRFLLGSVSDDVVHKAKCSVLIVPTKPY